MGGSRVCTCHVVDPVCIYSGGLVSTDVCNTSSKCTNFYYLYLKSTFRATVHVSRLHSFNSYNPTLSFDILNYMKSCNSAINSHSTTKSKLRHTLIPPLIYPASLFQSFSTLMEWSSCHWWKYFCFSHYEPVKIYFWLQFISNFNIDNLCTYYLLCPCTQCLSSRPNLL